MDRDEMLSRSEFFDGFVLEGFEEEKAYDLAECITKRSKEPSFFRPISNRKNNFRKMA